MKKNHSLHLFVIAQCLMVFTLNAGTFDGLRAFAQQAAASLWRKKVPLEKTSDMLPLSEYHFIKKTYTNDNPIDDLGRQLAAGVRCFEFDLSQKTRSRYLGFSMETVIVAGKNSREISSIILELNALLHTRQYEHEVIFIKFKNLEVKWLQHIKSTLFEKYIFTDYDASLDLLPLIGDLRHLDKRIVLMADISVTHNNIFFKSTAQNSVSTKELANKHNATAIGCDYFPKKARSFFSPHFNMYHYVGMDYDKEDKNTDEKTLKRHLAYGVRAFIFPLKQSPINVYFTESPETKTHNSIFIGETALSLVRALSIIDTFAKQYNEIIIIHLKNASQIRETDFNAMIQMYCKETCFTPTDRLADAKTIPLYGQILKKYADTETGAGPKKIWPRISWNYRNQKLVQITYDGNQDTNLLWAFNQYYDSNNSLRTADRQLFYSDVLKSEQKLAIGLTGAVAMALACLAIAQNLTSIAVYTQAIENKAYELWGKISLKLMLANQKEKDELGLTLMGCAVGLIAITKGIADVTTGISKSVGLYLVNRTNKTFTAVREGKIPMHTITYTNKSIANLIQEKINNPQSISLFDTAAQHNIENFASIDTLNMGWALRIAHTIRRLTAAKA